ncbi:thiolase family protein [Pelagerythrobacter sp.]|uniref:thiolase family protein n=1 Tax=Pelagerythrobacter sp. TaxID=2800702 RepID=UPI0035B1D766
MSRKFDRDVYVVGVGMHPFRNAHVPVRECAFGAGVAALDDAGLSFRDIETLYNGYITGFLMDGINYAKDLGMTGLPITHVENASATGSTAFREAVLQVAGGHVDCAMALGFDDLHKVQGVGTSRGGMEGIILPAAFFALWGVRRMHERGTTIDTFAQIAAKNWNHARFNVNAMRQADHEVTPEEVINSRKIAHPFTSKMAAGVGQGGACAIVATEKIARRIAAEQGRPLIRVAAAVQQSEQMTDGHIFMGAVVGPPEMTRTTAREAYEAAGFGPEDISLAQCHDAYPIEELLYYELLGFCGDGEGDRLVADGDTAIGGRIPFSTDGGLIARGHPGGPTGLAQIHEIALQLRGEAGRRQVEKARTGLAHMVGAGAVSVINILEKA